MRKVLPEQVQRGRVNSSWGSQGNYGAFEVVGPFTMLRIVSSGGEYDEENGWEHVSVACANRCPNWTEMAYVKDLFWDPEECVVQYHPPESDYVRNHPFALHMWRNKNIEFPRPPSNFVGDKKAGTFKDAEEAMAHARKNGLID